MKEGALAKHFEVDGIEVGVVAESVARVAAFEPTVFEPGQSALVIRHRPLGPLAPAGNPFVPPDQAHEPRNECAVERHGGPAPVGDGHRRQGDDADEHGQPSESETGKSPVQPGKKPLRPSKLLLVDDCWPGHPNAGSGGSLGRLATNRFSRRNPGDQRPIPDDDHSGHHHVRNSG